MLAVPFLGLLGAIQGACPNIASTALVGASRDLGMVGSTQALAASLQTLAIAATAITTGLLADRLGRRNVLMAALLVGGIGNLIVLAAPATAIYMLGMIVTGIGLGAVYGAAFGLLSAVVPPKKMAGAMGVFTASVMGMTLILTFVGGTLASSNWRLAYILLPAVCALCLVLTPILLPKVGRISGGSLDLFGQLLLVVAVVSFLYSVSQFATSLTAPGTLIPLGVGLVLFVVFFVWESKYHGHFYPVAIFKSPVFLAAVCAGFIFNFGTAVVFLQSTNLWQYVNGLKTGEVAIWQLPLLLAGIIAAFITGKLMMKGLRDRVVILVGGLMTAAGFVYLGLFNTDKTLLGFAPGLILAGAGVVIAAVPFGSLMLREAPKEFLGPVSSSRLTIGQIAYTLGLAFSTVLVDRLTRGGVVDKLKAAGVQANQIGTGLDAVTAYAARGTQPSTSLGKQALADAVASYGDAYATTLYVGAAVLALGGVVGFLLLLKDNGAPETAEPSAPAAT